MCVFHLIEKKTSFLSPQDNYNVLHIASNFSREDVVKTLLSKKGVDPYSTGGVSILLSFSSHDKGETTLANFQSF